jgi:glycosyltransferase involved in cell wall biosynthesis
VYEKNIINIEISRGPQRMKHKNILELCLSPDLGGLELFMVSCIEHFSQRTNVCIVVAPEKKLDHYLQHKTLFFLKRNKLFPIIPAIKLAQYIDNNHIDIIHFHWTKDIATIVLAKVLSRRKPKVIQSRHMSMTRFKDDFYHRWLYKNIDIMHAVTHQVKAQLEKFIPSKIRPNIQVVHPGTKIPVIEYEKVESLREKYALKDSFVVGMIGRIEEAKGQYLLLETIANLKVLNIKALIVGQVMNEAYLEELKTKIVDLGIDESVVFTGFTKEINAHIQLCDVTVLATPKETFGLVFIESMANGVPVISTNTGGPLEIIEDGKNGFFFNRTTQDLEKKIRMFYEDTFLQESIAKQALLNVKEEFDYTMQLKKLYEVMNES